MKKHIENCPHRRKHIEKHIFADRLFIERQYVDAEEFCTQTGNRCESCDDVVLKDCPYFDLEWTPGVCNMPPQCEKCNGTWRWFSNDDKIMVCDECGEMTEL